MKTVCRMEIADCIEEAFINAPLSPADLVEYAEDHGARSPVVQVLGRLHGDTYRGLRDLWRELADVPLEP